MKVLGDLEPGHLPGGFRELVQAFCQLPLKHGEFFLALLCPHVLVLGCCLPRHGSVALSEAAWAMRGWISVVLAPWWWRSSMSSSTSSSRTNRSVTGSHMSPPGAVCSSFIPGYGPSGATGSAHPGQVRFLLRHTAGSVGHPFV